jgi:hypothetical protein
LERVDVGFEGNWISIGIKCLKGNRDLEGVDKISDELDGMQAASLGRENPHVSYAYVGTTSKGKADGKIRPPR